jgi:fibronectin type 3 domain-containing protein
MSNRALSKLVRSSNLAVVSRASSKCQSLQKLSRFSSVIETLENRTLMSVSPAHLVTPHKTPAPPKTTVPSLTIPGTLSITAPSSTNVKVTWADADTTATGYKILRAVGNTAFTQVSQIASRTTFSYVDTAVSSNTSYSYKIEAFNATLTSAASSVVTIKTPLVAPINLSATAQTGGKMLLSWTDKDTSAAGYYVLRSLDGVRYTQVCNINSSTAATFMDGNLLSGQSYKYEVQAYQGTNTSAVSAVVAGITPLTAPAGLIANFQSSSLIHLSWTDKDASATGYQVLRSTDHVNFIGIATLSTAGANSLDDKAVLPFTTYYYQVIATSAATKSPASNIASAVTPLAIPLNAAATATSSGSVKLTWNDSDAVAKGFVILRSTNGRPFSQIAQIGVATTWTDSSVTADTTYSYEIQAVNGTTYSVATTPVSVSTPMSAPIGLTAAITSYTSVKLNWTDTDSAATQYVIMRSVNGAAFTTLATVTGTAASSYTDNAVSSGRNYSYDVTAASSTMSSAVSAQATAAIPLYPPTNVTATSTPASTIVLTWTNNDPGTVGFNLLRSNDGVTFSLLSKVSGAATSSFTDSTCASGHTYFYQVQAYGNFGVSEAVVSNKATTALLTPSSLAASVVGASINLSWSIKDSLATGYVINRSTDGVNFSLLFQLNSGSTNSYIDQSVTSGHKYYYQIRAVGLGTSSPTSAAVSVTVATPTPSQNSVTIATRYSGELVITATGGDDSISVTQSGSTLNITADGQTTTQPVPAAGLFIYTRGGTDGINVDQTVTVRTTIEAIDAAVDDITANGTNVSVWDDSSDVYTGTATVHTVSTFAGGVAKTNGASLSDPSDIGSTMHASGSLWGSGPVAADVNQGAVGDCYFLSSLAAFAGKNARLLQESAVDMGDGTYAVQYESSSGSMSYIRVNNDVSTYGGGSYVFARPGASGSLWAVIMEKAFAYFRTGANTYNSINSGWMGEVYADLGVNSTFFYLSSMTSSSLYSTLSTALAGGKEVTLGTGNAPALVSGHAYTLISCSVDANGVTSYVVRNPWGVSGDGLENSQGYATLSFAQMQANFLDCCVAV